MIPKLLHYIWLGRAPRPLLVQKCISTWYKVFPGYQIICWNEDNLSLDHPYLIDCNKSGKLAFAADFLRFQILEKYGGIYLDTDMEVIKNLDDFLNLNSFIGYEDESRERPGAAIVGSVPHSDFCTKMVAYYLSRTKNDSVIVCDVMSQIINSGVVDLSILSEHIFYPFNPYSFNQSKTRLSLMACDIKDDTFTIHHWFKSWI